MTHKQIEASREARLWLVQVVLPIVGIAAMVPEAREAVVTRIKNAKQNIESAFKKN